MNEDLAQYLAPTTLLDFQDQELRRTYEHLVSFAKGPRDRVKKLYAFVSELKLGYSANDDIAASRVLREGYGQCNTKVTLLLALARGAGVPSRLHAYRISKNAQTGRIPSWMLRFAPKATLFTWPEFYLNGSWVPLQTIVHVSEKPWNSCPFDGAKYQREPLKKEWILEDHGVYASPDEYFKKHKPSVHGWRALGWHLVGRRTLNKK